MPRIPIPLNSSDLINNPWNTTFSAFTNILGSAFFLIPLLVIAGALYVKTRDLLMVSMYMITTGALFSGAAAFLEMIDIIPIFIIFIALGLTTLIFSLLWGD